MSHWYDFIGFTYNGVHSSTLKILRTSEGNRYNKSLFPTLEDSVVNVPGGDGQYYFDTHYGSQVFNISFAYDSLLEADIRTIQNLFNGKEVHDLIFDELPYKVYSAKPTGNSAFKYMPFEEGPDGRLFKGEGSISFTAFNPYARSRYKWLEDYTSSNIYEWQIDGSNLDEWITSSGIISKGYYDTFANGAYPVYNPGDADTDFMIIVPFSGGSIGSTSGLSIYLEGTNYMLNTSPIAVRGTDVSLRMNTKMNVLEGLNASQKPTGTLYNDLITSGDFFKIPKGGASSIAVVGGTPTGIAYDFLYI